MNVTFPDSITTWLVQAVGVSAQAGMCVAEPVRVTVFRNYFLQLDLPYSVVLGEQVEVRATLYNYLRSDRLAVSGLRGRFLRQFTTLNIY